MRNTKSRGKDVEARRENVWAKNTLLYPSYITKADSIYMLVRPSMEPSMKDYNLKAVIKTVDNIIALILKAPYMQRGMLFALSRESMNTEGKRKGSRSSVGITDIHYVATQTLPPGLSVAK